MKVWVLFVNFTMVEIWDRKPSIHDLKVYAMEVGWPVETVDGWRLEKWSLRPSTAKKVLQEPLNARS